MGHKDHRHAGVALKLFHQPQDLGLGGDVQGSGWLICDQELWLCHHGHGNHRALAHPAGKLKRIRAIGTLWIGKADALKTGQHLFLGLSLALAAMQPKHLGHLITYTVQR